MTDRAGLRSDIERLEALWAEPQGPLYLLRQREFGTHAADRVLSVLRTIEVEPGRTELPRRLVELTWFMPVFIGWQAERGAECGGDLNALDQFRTRVPNEILRILGNP